jgi:phosphonate degradation associated HDIG domain protein
MNRHGAPASSADQTLDAIMALYRDRGGGAYFGESVSMTEHALQAAHFARAAGASDAVVVAALLHDVGHLLEEVPDDLAAWTRDAGHEQVGADWLARRFPPEVAEPVRLHVPAKRYLLATESTYFAQLSPASVVTLKLQGGPMSPEEADRFLATPYHDEAVLVRRCDDRGKVAGLAVPRLEAYADLLRNKLVNR